MNTAPAPVQVQDPVQVQESKGLRLHQKLALKFSGMFAFLAALLMPRAAFAAPANDPLGGATSDLTGQIVAYIPVVLLAVVGIAVAIIGINVLFKLIRKAVSAA